MGIFADLTSKDKELYTKNGMLHIMEYFSEREAVNETPVHVINMNVVDNPEDATIGAFLLCDLAQNLSMSDDLDNDIDDIIQDFEAKCEREVLHTILFY